MGTDDNGYVEEWEPCSAWIIGTHVLPAHPAELDARELFKPGNVLVRFYGHPLAVWKVVTRTHFDAFYEWVQ